eukprot:TRINITY_DN16744_c0_g3_i1.p1 TRINITY_DN16744_c0_g3~~TRINITY_DN16744_c0_g3_i1.p1  ORF type:complete len:325 (+),score=70.84 TRINITY_DN16744_c0_g3_i1:42-1016(+)
MRLRACLADGDGCGVERPNGFNGEQVSAPVSIGRGARAPACGGLFGSLSEDYSAEGISREISKSWDGSHGTSPALFFNGLSDAAAAQSSSLPTRRAIDKYIRKAKIPPLGELLLPRTPVTRSTPATPTAWVAQPAAFSPRTDSDCSSGADSCDSHPMSSTPRSAASPTDHAAPQEGAADGSSADASLGADMCEYFEEELPEAAPCVTSPAGDGLGDARPSEPAQPSPACHEAPAAPPAPPKKAIWRPRCRRKEPPPPPKHTVWYTPTNRFFHDSEDYEEETKNDRTARQRAANSQPALATRSVGFTQQLQPRTPRAARDAVTLM